MIGSKVRLGFDGSAVAAGFAKVGAGFKSLGRGMATVGRTMLAPFVKLMAVLAPILGVAGLFKVGKDALESAAGFEEMALRMEQFTGSAAEAKKILDDLTKFSLATPFETKDLQEAATAFLAAGIKDGVPKLVKDVAAIARNGEQIGELTDALSKGFAKGKFQTEELNKFLERGINLLPELRKVTGLQGAEFQKAVEKGLKFKDVTQAIANMSSKGGAFYGMLAKQSQTSIGLISTLKSGFEELSKILGQPINDAIKPMIEYAISNVDNLLPRAKALGDSIASAMSSVFAVFKSGNLGELIWQAFKYAAAKLGEFLSAVLEYSVSNMMAKLAGTELGKKLGMGDGGSSRIVKLPNGKSVIQANYRTYEDTPENRAMVQGNGMSFQDAMRNSQGQFGSENLSNTISSIVKESRVPEQIEWLKKQGYNGEQLISIMKDIRNQLKLTNPQFP